MRLRAATELAGISRYGADLAIRVPSRLHQVPSELAIVAANKLTSPRIGRAPERPTDLWRLLWPWVYDGGRILTYRYTSRRFSPPPNQNCLDEFTRLPEIDDETRFAQAVLAFARRWGVLDICEHRKPRNHHRGAPCVTASNSRGLFTEPIEAWQRYSRQLRAILLVAANLYQGRPGDKTDWAAVENAEPSMISEEEREHWYQRSWAGNVVSERHVIALALDRWFRYGAVALYPQWSTVRTNPDETSFEIETIYRGLPGRLAVDLAAALRSPNGLYRCAACSRPFTPEERRRASNREKWCDSEECKLEQFRRNSKRYYERKKQRKTKQRRTR